MQMFMAELLLPIGQKFTQVPLASKGYPGQLEQSDPEKNKYSKVKYWTREELDPKDKENANPSQAVLKVRRWAL